MTTVDDAMRDLRNLAKHDERFDGADVTVKPLDLGHAVALAAAVTTGEEVHRFAVRIGHTELRHAYDMAVRGAVEQLGARLADHREWERLKAGKLRHER